MAQPQAYERVTDFTERDGDDTDHASLNNEFDAAALSIDELRDNLALIQRDDGALKNGIVTADALAPSAFDAVLVQVNEATQTATDAATAATTAASTSIVARDAAVVARSGSESARDTSVANAAVASASATAAAASQSSASGSAQTAQTAASAASASQAAAAASASSASSSAATATAQAGTATTKAADASASATASAASASTASAAKTSAESARDGSQTARSGAESARDVAVGARDAAQASASAASSSQAAAGTSATAAATSASAAQAAKSAAETARDAAATARTGAESARDAAAASQAAAATSANAAASSQTAAASSASSAATSATSAAASLASFRSQYLGASATTPTVDGNGGALTAGDLYFDTALSQMRVYTGTAWTAAGSTVNGTAKRQTFTATAGQTNFAITGGYDAGFADVYLNGSKLVNGDDVAVTSGTNVVLATGAVAGDVLDVIAYGAFAVANTVAKTGDTMTGDLIVPSLLTTGSVGVGATPSAWASGNRSIDGAADFNVGANGGSLRVVNNAYFDGTSWRYKTTGAASLYAQAGGAHAWYTAPSGTAGTSISFAQSMTLTPAGDLLVGKSSVDWSVRGLQYEFGGNGSRFLVLTNNGDTALSLRRNSSDGNIAAFHREGSYVGGINVTASTTSYSTSSDYRLKTDVAPMTGALARVSALRPVTYKWKAEGSDGEGFIAHELAEVCPQAVTGEKDATDADGNPVYQGIDTSFLAGLFAAALQELTAKVTALEADLAAMKEAK